MREEFATVDEVNTVLGNYVQKKDLPPAVDMSDYAKLTTLEEYAKISSLDEYRKKNDLLSYTDGTIMKNIEFTYKSNLRYASFALGYLEGARFTLKYEYVSYDFDFTIDEETQDGPNMFYDHNLTDDVKLRWFVGGSSGTSKIYLLKGTNNSVEEYELLSITYPGPDEFALKSELIAQISALKVENELLAAQITSLKPTYPWLSLYRNFDERVEFIGNYHAARYIYYTYNAQNSSITITINVSLLGTNEYLLIIVNNNKTLTYIRLNQVNRYAYLNEITGGTEWSCYATGIVSFGLSTTLASSESTQRVFDYIFRKPVAA